MIDLLAICKSFAGVPILRNVNITVPTGHTLGLVGENGAGKSTLMNVLGGNLRPDSGQMRFNGRPYTPRDPLDATRQGIAFIHQELNLFPNLTIGENLFLTSFPETRSLPLIDRRALRQKTADLLSQVGLAHSPDTLVERLSAGERQLVEIAKALSIEARLIIFDEPTTSLGTREAEKLFELMGRLRQQGISLIYISHTLSDVLRQCDDIVVLRDGEVVGAGPRNEFTAERMISLMVGRNLDQLYPSRKQRNFESETGSPVVLEARHLTQPGIVRDICLALHRGEVLGLAGLMGAGRSELARILFGLDPCDRGELRLNGETISRSTPRRRIQRGLAFLTENRREEGLCRKAAIADNIALASLRQHAHSPLRLLDCGGLRQTIQAIRHSVRLTPSARDEVPVETLSGGNQQKVVLAKWLLVRPNVLILDEPTRGIDIGAKFEIYQLIHEQADQGAGVIVISSELEELIGICDRILVMSHGEIRAEQRRAEFDRERILAAAFGRGKAT